MKIIICFCLLLCISFANAQNPLYNAYLIPDSLKKDASAIVRFENSSFEITDIDRATYRVRKVITVLSEKASDYLGFQQYTSDFYKLEEANIIVYDELGKIVEKHKKKDMRTVAMGEGLVPNGFITYLDITATKYPITIELNYEIKYKGTLNFPSFYLAKPDQSIELAQFTVTVPLELDIKYKTRNSNAKTNISIIGNSKTYNWKVANQPSLKSEIGTLSYENLYPVVLIAPNKFKLDDYEGDMSSWKSFGKWYGSLKKDLDILPENVLKDLQNLVVNIASEKEKIKTVYTYLQHNFRYVSIQLGIGGFKPFSAEFTHQKKYGDCKALSNYTQTCLKAIGIKSYLALINAGANEQLDASFPSNQFNHVIVCVPLQKDTIWLECTSKTNDFGELGNFTENRNALLITEDGGVLVSTPNSNAKQNIITSNTIIDLKNEKENVTFNITATGEFKQEAIYALLEQPKDIQSNYLIYALGMRQPDAFETNMITSLHSFKSFIKITYNKLQDFNAGSKYFFKPRIVSLWSEELPNAENRKQDFYFDFPFIKIDTTIFLLQDNFKIGAIPKNQNLSFAFGNFTTNYIYDEKNQQLMTIAKLELRNNKIPVAQFSNTKLFFDSIQKEYNEKVVLIKKE